jgi:hypothetical protein
MSYNEETSFDLKEFLNSLPNDIRNLIVDKVSDCFVITNKKDTVISRF